MASFGGSLAHYWCAFFLAAPLIAADGVEPLLAVREPAIRARLNAGQTVIVLPVDNRATEPLPVAVELRWLAPGDTEKDATPQRAAIPPGFSTIELPAPLTTDSVWARLRYTIRVEGQRARLFPVVTGTVALSEIAGHAFTLHAGLPGAPAPGEPVVVHARAQHPATGKPVEGITWTAQLKVGLEIRGTAQPAAAPGGTTVFTFDPPDLGDDSEPEGEIVLTASAGDFQQRLTLEIDFDRRLTARLETDKPIYQPGQPLRWRVLLRGPDGRAAAGRALRVSLEDPAGDPVASAAEVKTSRFGIAYADFTLPESAETGEYRLRVKTDDADETRLTERRLPVRRYELPTFRLEARPALPAFTRADAVRATVTARYLFGEPVPGARIRVTNPKDDDDETEPPVAQGAAAADGSFAFALPAAEEWRRLQQDPKLRFLDRSFTIQATDPSTRRTAKTTLTIRLTRERLHLYGIQPATAVKGLPQAFYLITYLADGTPAAAALRITADGQPMEAATNRLGLARLMLPAGTRSLSVKAATPDGATGTFEETLYQPNEPTGLRLTAARTLLAPGDPIIAAIDSAGLPPGEPVVVTVLSGGRRLASVVTVLAGGAGRVEIPYQPEFRGVLTLLAWPVAAPDRSAARAVLFPERSGLRLTVAPGQPAYRPGETASVALQVTTAAGEPVEAAIGLTAVDEAIRERVRADGLGYCEECDSEETLSIGGVSLPALLALPEEAPRTPELDLAAEALLAHLTAHPVSARTPELDGQEFPLFRTQIEHLRQAIAAHFGDTLRFPLAVELLAAVPGVDWIRMTDPWASPYRAEFGITRENWTITLHSAGPDKRPGTADDLVAGVIHRPFFGVYGAMIRIALADGQDCPATTAGLYALLRTQGLDLAALRDPWNHAYAVEISAYEQRRFVTVRSAGPDGEWKTGDELMLLSVSARYFRDEDRAILSAVSGAATPPTTAAAFAALLESQHVPFSRWRDDWGRPYRIEARPRSAYEDNVLRRTRQTFGAAAINRVEVIPVTRRYLDFHLRSAGPNGRVGDFDDFSVGVYPVRISEETRLPPASPPPPPTPLPAGSGAIRAIVEDPVGGVIAGAHIRLTDGTNHERRGQASATGEFLSGPLPPGIYELYIDSPGFQHYLLSRVPVTAGQTTDLGRIQLQVGMVTESVVVADSAEILTMETASVATQTAASGPIATPRLRRDFPETLLWLPELITGADGRAAHQFRLADSITTWNLAARASTVDGRTVTAAADLRAFQPLFLDFQPPARLTQGDRVELPATVRNYQETAAAVELTWEPNAWSASEAPRRQSLSIAPGESATVRYPLTAAQATASAAQRVTATAGAAGDAIERTLTVRPDGQELRLSYAGLLAGRAPIPLALPPAAIAGATRGELRIYPHAAALAFESAEALTRLPTLCAEQTISTGLAHLTAARLARVSDRLTPEYDERTRRAIGDLALRLGGFLRPDGAVAYWNGGPADAAVTAHALRFLVEAREVTTVPPERLRDLAGWLARALAVPAAPGPAAGVMKNSVVGDGNEPVRTEADRRRARLTRGLIANALAAARRAGVEFPADSLNAELPALAAAAADADEPYHIGLALLTALEAGRVADADAAAAHLLPLGRAERGGLFWDLGANTPFYGWGTPGRIEATAMAVRALAAWRAARPAGGAEADAADAAIRRGLAFLIGHRQGDGAWFSAQATFRTLDAIAAAAGTLPAANAGTAVELWAGGRRVESLALPADPRAIAPLRVDLTPYLAASLAPALEIAGPGLTLAQVAVTAWVPWAAAAARQSDQLAFGVRWNRTAAAAGEPVEATITARRSGFRGYGMLLAEVGLPPGAEVDRAALEQAAEEVTGLDHFSIEPDRVVFYLWPRAEGVSFPLRLRPRFPMSAQSAASVLYDYNNPESLTEVRPARFTITAPRGR